MHRNRSSTILIGTGLAEGPISQQNVALAHCLTDHGFRVSLLVHGPDESFPSIDSGVSVMRWPSLRPTRMADAVFFDRLLRDARPCCLISHFGANNVMMLGGALRRVPVRVRWYHTLASQIQRDSEGESRLNTFLRRQRARIFFRFATHIVANSVGARNDLLNTFCLPEDKCRVFWNGLRDPFKYSGNGGTLSSEKNERNRFVCAGRFSPSKGQDILIRALPKVASLLPDIVIEFVGDGSARQACENLAAELGVSSRCRFTGKLSHQEVLMRMSGARATIVPSRAEAFGLVSIESMSLGTPVIGADTGGIAEVVRNGIDGLLFPPGDDEALGRRVAEIALNDSLRRRLGASSRKRFLESFELSHAVKAQADWIGQVIAASA